MTTQPSQFVPDREAFATRLAAALAADEAARPLEAIKVGIKLLGDAEDSIKQGCGNAAYLQLELALAHVQRAMALIQR